MRNKHHQTPHGGTDSQQRPSLRGRRGGYTAKYPEVEMVKKTRDLQWIRQYGTNAQRAQLKREGLL